MSNAKKTTRLPVIHSTEIPHQFPVILYGNGKRFIVQYGAEFRECGSYASAAHEYGECIFHALACANLLSDEA